MSMSSEPNTIPPPAAIEACIDGPSKEKRKDAPPLAHEDTLRDLAILRASDVDLAAVLASTATASVTASTSLPTTAATSDAVEEAAAAMEVSVSRSYEFARAARVAIKIKNRGDVEAQVERVNGVRGKLEDIAAGLRDG